MINEQDFRAILSKFKNENAPPLPFQPCIEHLLDGSYLQDLLNGLHAEGKWERRVAVQSLGESLPNRRGLYMFVWRPELTLRFADARDERFFWVLYIGKAGVEEGTCDTIKSRYVSEYSRHVGRDASGLWDDRTPERREELLARYLTLRPLEYWFILLDKPKDIELYERRLLHLLRPPLNKQHTGPRIRPCKPVPAFEVPNE